MLNAHEEYALLRKHSQRSMALRTLKRQHLALGLACGTHVARQEPWEDEQRAGERVWSATRTLGRTRNPAATITPIGGSG